MARESARDDYRVEAGTGRNRDRLNVINARGRVVGYIDTRTGAKHVGNERDRLVVEGILVAFLHSTPLVEQLPPLEPQTLRPRHQPAARPPKRLRRSQLRPWLVGLLLFALWATPSLLPRMASPAPAQSPVWNSAPPVQGVMRDPDRPTPTWAESQEPLGEAPLVPSSSGPHVFSRTQKGTDIPVAYDPCRPLPYVVNWRTAPREAEPLLREAVQVIENATGLRFVAEGATDEAPVAERPAFMPDRYGDRWAPILVAWSEPEEVHELREDFSGIGGSTSIFVPDANAEVYVSGLVALDGPQILDILAQPDGEAQARAVIIHELAHVVGLDHVNDPGQLMYPTAGVTAPQSGDLAGLAALGAGACFKQL